MPPLETLRKLYQVFSDSLNDANCLRFTYLCDYSRQNICGMFLASLQMLSKNVATDLDSQSASTEPADTNHTAVYRAKITIGIQNSLVSSLFQSTPPE